MPPPLTPGESMAIKRFAGRAGTLVVLEHKSKVLKDNLLGDPHLRKLAVWLPPQYDAGATAGKNAPGRRFPCCSNSSASPAPASPPPAGDRSATTFPGALPALFHTPRLGL